MACPSHLMTLLRAIAVMLVFLPLSAIGEGMAAPFVARYSVTVDGFRVGEMERSLRSLGDRYVIETRMHTTGLVALFRPDEVVETSTWHLAEGEPVPVEYNYRRSGREGERVSFDWQEGVAISQWRGRRTLHSISSGMLDKLLYQLLLRRDLAANRPQLSYEVVDRGEVRPYRFRVLGTETLGTALGEMVTVKVERVNDSDERETYFWCAPQLDYMLVRIEQHEDDHVYRSDIESLTR